MDFLASYEAAVCLGKIAGGQEARELGSNSVALSSLLLTPSAG